MLEVRCFFLTNQVIGNITVTDNVNSTTYTPTTAWPFNAASGACPYSKLVFAQGVVLPTGEGQLTVNAKWGWIAVPTTIKNACLIQASRYVKRRDSPLGVLGSDQTGGVVRVGYKLDSDVAAMLSSYRHWWAAA